MERAAAVKKAKKEAKIKYRVNQIETTLNRVSYEKLLELLDCEISQQKKALASARWLDFIEASHRDSGITFNPAVLQLFQFLPKRSKLLALSAYCDKKNTDGFYSQVHKYQGTKNKLIFYNALVTKHNVYYVYFTRRKMPEIIKALIIVMKKNKGESHFTANQIAATVSNSRKGTKPLSYLFCANHLNKYRKLQAVEARAEGKMRLSWTSDILFYLINSDKIKSKLYDKIQDLILQLRNHV